MARSGAATRTASAIGDRDRQLGLQMQQARLAAGLTRSEAARAASVSERYLAGFERCGRPPAILAERLADIYGRCSPALFSVVHGPDALTHALTAIRSVASRTPPISIHGRTREQPTRRRTYPPSRPDRWRGPAATPVAISGQPDAIP